MGKNMQTITNEFFKETFKQDHRLFNWLNHDNLLNIVVDGDIFWIELTWSGATLPDYAFNHIKKWCAKRGLRYLYDITN